MKIKIYANVGCMGSGKTSEVIKEGNKHLRAGRSTIAFRPQIDNRVPDGIFQDKNGMKFNGEVRTVQYSQEILAIAMELKLQALLIDEGQFFDIGLAKILEQLAGGGVVCSYAGLDTDYLARPFPTTEKVLGLPEVKVFRWKAICDSCGEDATRSIKRLADNRIVTSEMDSKLIEIGEAQYNSLCYLCFREAMNGTLSEEKMRRLISKKL